MTEDHRNSFYKLIAQDSSQVIGAQTVRINLYHQCLHQGANVFGSEINFRQLLEQQGIYNFVAGIMDLDGVHEPGQHAEMVIHLALVIYPFKLVLALHSAEGDKAIFVIIVGFTVTHETLPKLAIRSIVHT